MTISGNTVTIVLGTYIEPGGGQGNRETAGGTGSMIWTPAAGLKDFAGNPLATTGLTESMGAISTETSDAAAIRQARRRGPRIAIAAAPVVAGG